MADLTKIKNLRESQLNEIAVGEIVLNVDAMTYVTKNSAGKIVPYDIDYKLPDGDATHLYLKWDNTAQAYIARTLAEFLTDLSLQVADVDAGTSTLKYLQWNNSTSKYEPLTSADMRTALAVSAQDVGTATELYPKWNGSKYSPVTASTLAVDIGAVSTANYGEPVGGYLFDGTNDYVIVTDNANLDFGTKDFSLSMLILLSDYTPSAEKILLEKHASNLGYKLLLTTDGKLKLQFGNGSDFTTYSYTTDALSLTDGTLYHIAISATRSSNALFYVNGVLRKTVDISGSVSQTLDNTGALNIMGNGTAYHNGLVFLIRAFNRVITQTEIIKLYNNGNPELAQLNYKDIKASQTNLKSANTWTNGSSSYAYETFTTDGDSVTSAINDAGNYGIAVNGQGIPVTNGKTYRLYYTLTLNSGAVPAIALVDSNSATGAPVSNSATLTNGSGYVDLTATATATESGYLVLSARSLATNFGLTITSIVRVGCVAEYLPRNAGWYSWIETQNGLHGTATGGVIPLSNKIGDTRTAYLLSTSESPTMTDVIKAGWAVQSISMTTAQNLTDIDVVQETSSVALIENKTLNNGSFTWTPADHNLYPTADKDLVFKLTGNGGAGTHIYVNLKEIV